MKKHIYILSFFYFILFIPFSTYSGEKEENGFMFRMILKNKGNSPYSINKPSEFLSEKAINRRLKQGIAIDSIDLPLDTAYMARISETGATIKAVSKWFGTVTAYFSDSSKVQLLNDLPFVDTITMVWKGQLLPSSGDEGILFSKSSLVNDVNVYGDAYTQIHLNNGDLLHAAGFRGEGMDIAVIDGGFKNCDQVDFFNQSQILGAKNFTHKKSGQLYDSDVEHGTKVLSCMLSNKAGKFVGTAPKANYYLISTEITGEEFPVEEDYWIAGIEYADSLGVSVVNSSLGYSTFDMASMNHTYEELDGKSVLISRAATMAANKGMLVFIAAGNDGNKAWKKISVPADADRVITVGSIKYNTEISDFSSLGPAADGRVKPDMLAMGSSAALIGAHGSVEYGSGTSFACPILAGLGACLWQALPGLSNMQIIELMKKNSSYYNHPDSVYGFGIPDVYKAYTGNGTRIPQVEKDTRFLSIDPVNKRLYVNLDPTERRKSTLSVYSVLGNKITQCVVLTQSVDISNFSKGVYIAHLEIDKKRYVKKFIIL